MAGYLDKNKIVYVRICFSLDPCYKQSMTEPVPGCCKSEVIPVSANVVTFFGQSPQVIADVNELDPASAPEIKETQAGEPGIHSLLVIS